MEFGLWTTWVMLEAFVSVQAKGLVEAVFGKLVVVAMRGVRMWVFCCIHILYSPVASSNGVILPA